jgi:hypothetical protein
MNSVQTELKRFQEGQWMAKTAASIEKHTSDFVSRYCVVDKIAFVPGQLFVDALNDYYRLVGDYEDIEYYYKNYVNPRINIVGTKYDKASGMMLGVRLVSWPS